MTCSPRFEIGATVEGILRVRGNTSEPRLAGAAERTPGVGGCHLGQGRVDGDRVISHRSIRSIINSGGEKTTN